MYTPLEIICMKSNFFEFRIVCIHRHLAKKYIIELESLDILILIDYFQEIYKKSITRIAKCTFSKKKRKKKRIAKCAMVMFK